MGIIIDDKNVYNANGEAVLKLELLNETNLKLYNIKSNDLKSSNVLIDKKIITTNPNKKEDFVIVSSYIKPVLINLSKYDYKTIKFNSPYKMLVSNDLITWHNYLNKDNYVSEKIDKRCLETYLNDNTKELDLINNRYNYLYIKPNKVKTLNRMYELFELENGIKLNRQLIITSCENSISIYNPTTRTINKVVIRLFNAKNKIINTLRSRDQ